MRRKWYACPVSLFPRDAAARSWLADDPDPEMRAVLRAWLDAGDVDAVNDAFRQRLQFGTAGVRGPRGPGPNRMNRRLARLVAAGIATHLTAEEHRQGVVVGRDARLGSAALADDVAAVLAGAGVRTRVLPGTIPTPVLAFAVRHLGAAAGVMVTASHNPPSDDGIKVFGSDGAQIVAPVDAEISDAIDAVDSVLDLPLGQAEHLGEVVLDAYLDAAAARVPPGPRDAVLVHTALHGVATAPLVALLERAGFPAPHLVAAQAAPDPGFPTVAYPNPEEPGALDLALAEARRVGADAVLANDPDADRLAVAIPDRGSWRILTGDELGALLGEQALAATSGNRLVISTIVSSTLLGRLAAEAGATWRTTLPGFKWIIRTAREHPEMPFVFGYEEALGYGVHDLVHDKDGITAAAAFAALVASLKAGGETVADRLDAIARRHGVHATRQSSVRLEGAAGARSIASAVDRVIDSPPTALAGRRVTAVERPAERIVTLTLEDGARVVIRPSGTEPKLKVYAQVVLEPSEDVGAARSVAEAIIVELLADAARALGLGD